MNNRQEIGDMLHIAAGDLENHGCDESAKWVEKAIAELSKLLEIEKALREKAMGKINIERYFALNEAADMVASMSKGE